MATTGKAVLIPMQEWRELIAAVADAKAAMIRGRGHLSDEHFAANNQALGHLKNAEKILGVES